MAIIGILFGAIASLCSAHAADPDIAWIKNSISQNKIKSVEEMLARLPRDYTSQHTLVFDSHSTQGATPLAPRAIIYGQTATLLTAFNGDKNLPGHECLEMIQFNDSEAKFEFFVAKPGSGPGALLDVKPGVGCTHCHAADPRPNWQPYNLWPGVYGSDDDALESYRSNPTERDNLKKFLKIAPNHGRYKWLANLKEGYLRGSDLPYGNERTSVEHNQTFTYRINQLGFARTARLIRATPNYNRYKFAILGSLVCGHIGFEQFIPGTPALHWGLFAYEIDDYVPVFNYVFNSRKIDMKHWSLAIDGVAMDPLDHTVFQSAGLPANELAGQLVRQDSELMPFVYYTETGRYREDDPAKVRYASIEICDSLKQKSRDALTR